MAGIRLSLNAMGVEQGKRDALKAFADVKRGAQSMAKGVDDAANKAASATQRLGAQMQKTGLASKNAGFIFGQTATQLGDIAVSLEMGMNPLRVLGQQVPQIAGAFSMLGGRAAALAGTFGLVAAVGFPLISVLMNMMGTAKSTEERLGELEERLDNIRDSLKLAKTPLSELTEEFGILAEGIKSAGEAAAEFDLYQAAREARDLRDSLTQGLLGTTPISGDVTSKLMEARDALASIGEEINGTTVSAMANLAERLGVTAAEAIPVYEALNNVREAATDQQMATAYTQLSEALFKLRPESEAAAQKIGEWATSAQSAGESMASILNYMSKIAGFGPLQLTVGQPPQGGVGRGRMYPNAEDIQYMRNGGEYIESDAERRRRLGTDAATRAGESAVKREIRELETFADRIKPVLSLLQEYEQNMEKLNRAKEIGAITAEEFATKEAILTQQFGIASGALADYTSTANVFADSLTNNMMALADGTLTVQDAFKSMATAVIKELYRVMVVQQAVNAIMGAFGYTMGAGGSYIKTPAPVPSMDGGGYTGSGARTGGLDGKGGFMAMLHPQETVVDHTKGQSSGVVVNQVINVSAGVSQTVRAEMMNLLPQFKQQATAGVLDAKRRGGSYGGAFA